MGVVHGEASVHHSGGAVHVLGHDGVLRRLQALGLRAVVGKEAPRATDTLI